VASILVISDDPWYVCRWSPLCDRPLLEAAYIPWGASGCAYVTVRRSVVQMRGLQQNVHDRSLIGLTSVLLLSFGSQVHLGHA
jgi:hypothetical protein